MKRFIGGGRRRAVVLVVIAALIAASAAAAAWIVYDLTIATGSVGGSTMQAGSHVGAFVITAGTPTQQGSPGQPADIALHVVNSDPNNSHTFNSTVTVGSPTITGGTGGCTLAQLTATTLSSIQSKVSATLAGQSVAQSNNADFDVTNAFTVSSTAPSSCGGTTVTFPISGTLAS